MGAFLFSRYSISFPDWVCTQKLLREKYIWQPQVATWGYSSSTPSGLCSLIFFIDFVLKWPGKIEIRP
jgi:hypothetical protein